MARLISTLAENGVSPTETSAAEYFEDPDWDQIEFFGSLVNWLESEGVVRLVESPWMGDGAGPTFSLVLTSLGFQHLARTQPNGLTLVENAKQIAASPNVASTAGEFVGSLLGAFTKSVTPS
ncbi:hypothetical protein [Frigidibacter sp. SD6-1]|uniref:hypothetical protein n=1 Tax=Frigidibacter sp. SD6-1 TaxID=3032581 RepID=UPI0024DF47CC|nr:hypothetical protein [Frigidibacter sp. SD6-1]